MDIEVTTVVLLCAASVMAGAMDAIVGGGGLIALPALLLGLPNTPVPSILAANKVAATMGTSTAAYNYVRHHPVHGRFTLSMMATGFSGSVLGALTATQLSSSSFKPIIFVVLVVVWLFVWQRKAFGEIAGERVSRRRMTLLSVIGGAGIGFYDGLIGPGTGSFLLFLCILGTRVSFVEASSTSKLVNLATNFGALLLFTISGHIWETLPLGLLMGAFNVVGSQVGSRLAIRKGSRFVRTIFLVVVALLIARLGLDLTGLTD